MTDDTTKESHKSVARRLLAAWNERGETHVPADLAHPRMVRHFGGSLGAAAVDGDGADAALPKDAFPDQRFSEQMLIADEKHVFIAWELTATNDGALFGAQPTGKTVTVYGSDVIRLADGKIIEHWNYYPKARTHALAQLGLLTDDVQHQLISEGYLGRNQRTGQASTA